MVYALILININTYKFHMAMLNYSGGRSDMNTLKNYYFKNII